MNLLTQIVLKFVLTFSRNSEYQHSSQYFSFKPHWFKIYSCKTISHTTTGLVFLFLPTVFFICKSSYCKVVLGFISVDWSVSGKRTWCLWYKTALDETFKLNLLVIRQFPWRRILKYKKCKSKALLWHHFGGSK